MKTVGFPGGTYCARSLNMKIGPPAPAAAHILKLKTGSLTGISDMKGEPNTSFGNLLRAPNPEYLGSSQGRGERMKRQRWVTARMKSPAWTGHLAGISVLASHYGGKEQRNKRQLGVGLGETVLFRHCLSSESRNSYTPTLSVKGSWNLNSFFQSLASMDTKKQWTLFLKNIFINKSDEPVHTVKINYPYFIPSTPNYFQLFLVVLIISLVFNMYFLIVRPILLIFFSALGFTSRLLQRNVKI